MSYSQNILADKSYQFAVIIIGVYKEIISKHKEYVLSKQILKSGTSIGALIHESEFAQSKADFINKLSISLKEANETKYWLHLLVDTAYIDREQYNKLSAQVNELIAILVASIKTAKKSLNKT